ncbi:hypothetical protein DSECCO2_631750 [anaerobic digester metagenome]
MKTSEDSISIETAISEDWLAKLYEQLSNPEWLVTELGLVTNSPLKIVVNFIGHDGERHRQEQLCTSEKTSFLEFNPIVIEKIKADIAERKGISPADVDLSKFVHMRTTLSIPKHREIVEQEMSCFLQFQYPRITVDSAKAIFSTMMDLLARRQSYELLNKSACFSEVREKKGVSKDDFSRIIEEAMLISIPQFMEVQRLFDYSESNKEKAALEYTSMLADFQSKSESFTAIFLKTRDLCMKNPRGESESIEDYCKRVYNLIPVKTPIYNHVYVSILVACILINEGRRMQ